MFPSVLDGSSINVSVGDVSSTLASGLTGASRYQGHFVLTTKRSHTPLITVSDAESDNENSSVATPFRSAKRQSPLSHTNGYFTSAMNYIVRPTFMRPPSRTTISLDNVDMWESDSESDQSQGFDKINIATIVPSKTIDFSALRRSRSPVVAHKRNRLEGASVHRTDNPTGTLRERILASPVAMTREPRSRPHSRGPRKVRTAVPKPQRCYFNPIRHEKRRDTSESAEVKKHIDKKPSPGSTIASSRKTLASKASASDVDSTRAFARSTLVKHSRDEVRSDAATTQTDRSPPKVKFNEYVTITDGTMNTFDLLRSSANSAQLFKKRFLRNSADIQRHVEGNSESPDMSETEFPT